MKTSNLYFWLGADAELESVTFEEFERYIEGDRQRRFAFLDVREQETGGISDEGYNG